MKYLYLVLALILGTYNETGFASSESEQRSDDVGTLVRRGRTPERQRQGSRSQSETSGSKLQSKSELQNRSSSVGTPNKGKQITDFFSLEALGSSVEKSEGRLSASSSGKGSPQRKKLRKIVKWSEESASTSPLASPSAQSAIQPICIFRGKDGSFIESALISCAGRWNFISFLDIIPQILPEDAFGKEGDKNIDVTGVVRDMRTCFSERKSDGKDKPPHIAVMSVVIGTSNERQCIFLVPYIFGSGCTTGGIIRRWRECCEVAKERFPALEQALNATFGTKMKRSDMPIGKVVKSIGDFGYSASKPQDQAHSERAAILCLLYDPVYSLKKIIDYMSAPQGGKPPLVSGGEQIKQVIIQIKVICPKGACENCQNFLRNNFYCNRFELVRDGEIAVSKDRTPFTELPCVEKEKTEGNLFGFVQKKEGRRFSLLTGLRSENMSTVPIQVVISYENDKKEIESEEYTMNE